MGVLLSLISKSSDVIWGSIVHCFGKERKCIRYWRKFKIKRKLWFQKDLIIQFTVTLYSI